jgi:hypothetical protein
MPFPNLYRCNKVLVNQKKMELAARGGIQDIRATLSSIRKPGLDMILFVGSVSLLRRASRAAGNDNLRLAANGAR